jgi:hypothetical protein
MKLRRQAASVLVFRESLQLSVSLSLGDAIARFTGDVNADAFLFHEDNGRRAEVMRRNKASRRKRR